jgi:hypothetical protein
LVVCVAGVRAEEAAVAKAEVPPSVLARFDKNKDGKLDATERAKWEAENARRREKDAARKAEMLARFDTNKDGKLDADERASAKISMMQDRTEADAAKLKARMEKEAKANADADQPAAAAPKAEPKSKSAAPADSMMSESAPAKDGDDKMMMQQ